MPDKSKQFYGRRRNRRRDTRRPLPQAVRNAPVAQAQETSGQVKPLAQAASAARVPVKAPPQLALKVKPVKELRRIGIIAGSMFLILFILAFLLNK